MVGPFPKDAVIKLDGRLSRVWDSWMTNVQNNVDFGKPPSSLAEITATGGIQVTTESMRIISSTAGNVTVTANPRITPMNDNAFLRLEGNDDTRTVTLADGNGLSLTGGTTVVLGNNDVIAFHFNKSKDLWVEDYRSNK